MTLWEWIVVLMAGWLALSLLIGVVWMLTARELNRRHRRRRR